MEFGGLDEDAAHGAAVGDGVEEQGVGGEVGRGTEGMAAEEARAIDAQADVERRHGHKVLAALDHQALERQARPPAEVLVAEALEPHLGVGFGLAVVEQTAAVIVVGQEDEAQTVVAVVDQEDVEGRCGKLVQPGGHESQLHIGHVAAAALKGARLEGDDGIVVIHHGVQGRLQCSIGGAGSIGSAGGCFLRLGHVIFVGGDDHQFVDGHGHFKAVVAGDKGYLRALKGGDDAAAHVVEKSYFIAYLHRYCVIRDGCAKIRIIGERRGREGEEKGAQKPTMAAFRL